MALILHGHAFSSYTWKALIALYEKDLPFEFSSVDDDAAADLERGGRLKQLWPLNKFPVLEDGEKVLIESSIIIEHLDLHYPPFNQFIPVDPTAALETRFMDRVFDNHFQARFQVLRIHHEEHAVVR